MTATRVASFVVVVLSAAVAGACDYNIVSPDNCATTMETTLDVYASNQGPGYVLTRISEERMASLRDHGWQCSEQWDGGDELVLNCGRNSCWY